MLKDKIAFIGRSNVGKSSLINFLLDKGVAQTSKNPGKTRKHDLFQFSQKIDFVDMPGYGFTRSHGKHRDLWDDAMTHLFFEDPQFKHLMVLIDSTIKPMQIDKDYIGWLVENGVPFSVIFTKVDKAKPKETAEIINNWKNWINLLPNSFGSPDYFEVSALLKKGKEQIVEKLLNTD